MSEMKFKVPPESITLGVIDNDVKGESGGTHYYVTQTIHFRVTDSREEFMRKAIKAYDIIQNQLVR
jgi:hypothetical protein